MPVDKGYKHRLDKLPPLTNVGEMLAQRAMFIGCGGLGFEAVNLLKLRIEQFMGTDVNQQRALKFLAIDSADAQVQSSAVEIALDKNTEMLQLDLRGWRGLIGRPGIREWFTQLDDMRPEIRSRILKEFPTASDGCGTTRPMGRLGLFNQDMDLRIAQKIRDFKQGQDNAEQGAEIDGKPLKVQGDSDELFFYIVSSLGGGTGTGIFMDVAAIIRHIQKMQSPGAGWRIYGLLVTPALLAKLQPSGTSERIMANSYAALKELMNLMEGEGRAKEFQANYNPSDTARSILHSGTDFETSIFNGAYLIDGEASNGFKLSSRAEIANFISGFLFQMAFTTVGAHALQRTIDTSMSGIFHRRLPQPEPGRVIETQRASFSDFGWSTVHIPLGEMLEHGYLETAYRVVRKLGCEEERNNKSSKKELQQIREFVFIPKKGQEPNRFIDRVGLSLLITSKFWRILATGIDDQDSAADQELTSARIFQQNALKPSSETPAKAAFSDGDDGDLSEMKPKELLEEMQKQANQSEPVLVDSRDRFLSKFLGLTEENKDSPWPVENSPLGTSIEEAYKEFGTKFVLEGIKHLRQAIGDIEGRANGLIDGLQGTLNRQKELLHGHMMEVQQISQGFLANTLTFLVRDRLNMEIEDYTGTLGRLNSVKVLIAFLKELTGSILPAYEDQLIKWARQIDKSHTRLNELVDALWRKQKLIKNRIAKSTRNEFNIPFSGSFIDKFWLQLQDLINIDELARELRVNGFVVKRSGEPEEKLTFMEGMATLTSRQIEENLTKVIYDRAANASQDGQRLVGADLFRLNFDEFTYEKEQADRVGGEDSRERSELFIDDENGGDIQRIHEKLIRHGTPLTKINGFVEQVAPLEYKICNSRIWSSRLPGELIPGKYGHKVTFIRIRQGFAPYQLDEVKEWYRHYRNLLDRGEILHIFSNAKSWIQEPYTEHHFVKRPEELFQVASSGRYGKVLTSVGENDVFRVEKVRPERFEGSFCQFTIQDELADIIAEISLNGEAYTELGKRLLSTLEREGNSDGARELLINGVLPSYLFPSGLYIGQPVNTTGRSEPLLIIDEAIKHGLIKKIDGDRYEFKISTHPKTENINFVIQEDKDTIVRELGINEPFYEMFCEWLIFNIEIAITNSNEKHELLKSALPVLPKQLAEPLLKHYGFRTH